MEGREPAGESRPVSFAARLGAEKHGLPLWVLADVPPYARLETVRARGAREPLEPKKEVGLKGSWSLRGRRWIVLALVAVLGLTLAVAVGGASAATRVQAHAAKKCKKHNRMASVAKKKCKKKKKAAPVAPVVAPPAPTPTPLSNPEIIDRVNQKALEYGNQDSWFDGYYGYWSEDDAGFIPKCSSKSDFSATCEGWYEWYDFDFDAYGECDFYEVVERDGLTGIRSHLDTSFGSNPGDGFECYYYPI